MNNSILDYDESLNDLERQKEQLDLVMQKMGEEWEKSGPGISWLKLLQNSKGTSSKPTVGDEITAVDNTDLTPAASLETSDDLIDILQQQPQRPSPEYLQSLLNVNETLLAQSLAASPMVDGESTISTFNVTTSVASPLSEETFDVCTPGLNSVSSAAQSSTPTTPDNENGNVLHLTNRKTEDTPADSIPTPVDNTTLCLPNTPMDNDD